MIPNLPEFESKDTFYYNHIYNNIDILKKQYDSILNPDINNTTKIFLNEGYNANEAYCLSFLTTLNIFFYLNNVKI